MATSSPVILNETERDWLMLPFEAAHLRFGEPVNAAWAASGFESRTTVMMRKVPRRLNHEELFTFLDQHTAGLCGEIEFMYLPRDLVRRSNRGFCFINFRSHKGVAVLASLLQQRRLPDDCQLTRSLPEPLWNCQLYYANVQGKGEELRSLIEQRQSLIHTTSDVSI